MTRSLLQDNIVDEITVHQIIEPTVTSSTSGGGDVFASADTEKICSPNSIVKYVNIRLQSTLRDVAPRAPGWLEYAIVVHDEQTAAPVVLASMTSAIGTQTLASIMRNLFRGKCIWNGAFAISKELPRAVDIALKLPDVYCKNKRGKFLTLYKVFRSGDVSDTTTDCRTWITTQFNCYI